MQRTGLLLVISAPSGTGKTTLIKALCKSDPSLRVSTSCTTRPKRPLEKNQEDYFFLSSSTFDALEKEGYFLETCSVFDYTYGTPLAPIRESIAKGQDMILDVTFEGYLALRKMFPTATLGIFLLPPSLSDLKKRLATRAQDCDATILKRLGKAREEAQNWSFYDYVLMNKHLEETLDHLESIICAERLRSIHNPHLEKTVDWIFPSIS
jgi:guanylate kinase